MRLSEIPETPSYKTPVLVSFFAVWVRHEPRNCAVCVVGGSQHAFCSFCCYGFGCCISCELDMNSPSLAWVLYQGVVSTQCPSCITLHRMARSHLEPLRCHKLKVEHQQMCRSTLKLNAFNFKVECVQVLGCRKTVCSTLPGKVDSSEKKTPVLVTSKIRPLFW